MSLVATHLVFSSRPVIYSIPMTQSRPLLVINADKCEPDSARHLLDLGYDYIFVEGPDVPAVQSVPTKEDRRFTAAVAAMQGMLASEPPDGEYKPHTLCQRARIYADALLEELNKETP